MARPEEYPKSYRIFEIPLDDVSNLYIWYLHPHPTIEKLIEKYQWKARMIEGNMWKAREGE